jgi:hypothetical protein
MHDGTPKNSTQGCGMQRERMARVPYSHYGLISQRRNMARHLLSIHGGFDHGCSDQKQYFVGG